MTDIVDEEIIKLLLLILTAVFSFMNNRKVKALKIQGEEIHTLVNSKMSTALQRITDLEEEIKVLRKSTLEAASILIPSKIIAPSEIK